jgi:DNA repair photolyase
MMSGTPFRWQRVDDADPGLFGIDDLLLPDLGTGRMSDLEFLHVNAKRILNHVPSNSRAPANWTINVYRGCSHACSYCLAGDTPVLMADGRTKPIADIRAGDKVCGTIRSGSYRRYVPTDVVDHWSTVQAAWRITLEDGTELIASGDHRFLTGRGWKYVSPASRPAQRPSLTGDDELVAVKSDVNLRVLSVGALDAELPMYDITTGTGDFIANGVVSHNCFARPTHEYLGFNIGTDFDRKIVVKINAVEKLRAELADPRWHGETVAMGTNTDPYQRAEAKYRLTRGVLEVLAEHDNPFSILTKSPLVTRDLDVIARAADRAEVSVNFSIGTLDERVWRLTEPGAPHPRRRLDALAAFAQAGVRTGALVAPVLPGLSDSADQLREVVGAIADAGGRLLGIGALHLRAGLREHFLTWLADIDPQLHADYLRRYGDRAYAPQHYLDTLYERAGVPRRRASRARAPAPATRAGSRTPAARPGRAR